MVERRFDLTAHTFRNRLDFRLFVFAGLALSTFVGCVDSPRKESMRASPTEADYVIPDGDDDYERKIAKIARTFEHYRVLAEGIENCKTVELYEGLPHPTWESEVLERELREKEVVEFVDWPFYATPIELSNSDAELLRKLYCTRSSFVPFRGWKQCGGYHPDWCIKWKNGDKEFLVQICLGCCEMITTDGNVEVHCDIWDTTDFENILKPYQKRRPSWEETERLREKRRQQD